MFLCEGLAILVAVIAVMNGVASALLDRVDQLYVLRSVGLTPSGLSRMAVIEGGIVGFVGGMVGLLAGSAAAHRVLTVSWRSVSGFHMPIVWPMKTLAMGVVAAVLSGSVAGYLALRGAALGRSLPRS
jgi:putative ABC transport system permease protein